MPPFAPALGWRASVQSIRDQLDSVVATGVPGAVAVAVGPDGQVEAASGLADLRTGEVSRSMTASASGAWRIFVSALVLQLVAEGMLDLDGDAAPFAEGITIRQLLNHTSGLKDWVGDIVEFFEPYRRDPGHRFGLTPTNSSSWYWRNRVSSRPARGGPITAATTSC